jgi:HEAT repeat protein
MPRASLPAAVPIEMTLLDVLLMSGASAVVVLWAAVSLYVIAVDDRRTRARRILASAIETIEANRDGYQSLADRLDLVRPGLARASRELIMSAVADKDIGGSTREVLAAYLVERWGVRGLERDAEAHRTAREKWRRIAALRILLTLGHPSNMRLLAGAVRDNDDDVASTALALLGDSADPEAVDILLQALRHRQQPASRIALALDRSPQHLADRLRPLLGDADPVVRRWAVTLVGRYPDVDGIEHELAAAADDVDPGVRKAAVQSLGHIGDTVAAAAALRLLGDPVPFVRAAALRAIAALDRDDFADRVAGLLGDHDWWVRLAAKQCLESLGPDIWPVLVRRLDDPDRFVRNGAAEVFQNLGVLDSFIVMEAATADPADRRIALLRSVAAAGELRLTDSLIERAGSALAPRIRSLLSAMGFQHVGAAS